MKPKISICCLCYNHSEYLTTAFESFLAQKGSFDIEIVIFDDCSTDNSRDIIRMYREKYPDVFKLIFPEENIYQQGKTAYYNIINKATGQFLAFCEGDDYWVSDIKLEKQLEFINNNVKTDLVFHPALTLYDNGKIVDNGYGVYNTMENHSFKRILSVSGGYMPMASIFARKSAFTKWFEQFPQFFSENTWHSTIQILAAYKNGAGYLPEHLSVYRSMHEGSWSRTMANSSIAAIKDFEAFCIRNRKLNEITNYEYKNTFDQVLLFRTFKLAKNRNITLKQKIKQYQSIPYKITAISKSKYFILSLISELLRYANK